MKALAFTCALLLLPASAWPAESPSMGSAVMQMLWALLIVIGLILIIYGIAKKRFGLGNMQTGAIKVIEIRHIMPKTSLALIEVRGKELLIGIGAGRIELLADFSDQSEAPKDFDEILNKQQ